MLNTICKLYVSFGEGTLFSLAVQLYLILSEYHKRVNIQSITHKIASSIKIRQPFCFDSVKTSSIHGGISTYLT